MIINIIQRSMHEVTGVCNVILKKKSIFIFKYKNRSQLNWCVIEEFLVPNKLRKCEK